MDASAAYRALKTRDARFDGRFFVGVLTTGVYCRTVCSVVTPREKNCRFYPSAAAAQEAGFRPCLRCRPENAPLWGGTSRTVSRGLQLIAEGGFEDGVEALAERLGIGERQLRRLFQRHLGTTPVAVAQTRRVLFAKQLITDTSLSMSDIAFAAGFGSVRRFNETFQTLYKRPPSALRKAKSAGGPITLQLPYRPPYDWGAMLGWWAARAVDGVESVGDGVYRRNLDDGSVAIAHDARRHSLVATIEVGNVRGLAALVGRIRQVFDVSADVGAIEAHLAHDPLLKKILRPGLRVPGGWSEFEVAVRAVLGQQVTIAAARKLLISLVKLCGTRSFPSPAQVATADLGKLGMPSQRRDTLRRIARGDYSKGIGEWTRQYIALRALHEPDAFPATDVALIRAAKVKDLEQRAEAWRPWRAYAAQHLWSINHVSK